MQIMKSQSNHNPSLTQSPLGPAASAHAAPRQGALPALVASRGMPQCHSQPKSVTLTSFRDMLQSRETETQRLGETETQKQGLVELSRATRQSSTLSLCLSLYMSVSHARRACDCHHGRKVGVG
jgi:hypothetical protein